MLKRSLFTLPIGNAAAILPTPASAQDYVVNRLTTGINASPTVAVSTQLHLPTDIDFAAGVSDFVFVSQLGGVNSDGSDGDDVTKKKGRMCSIL